MNNDKKMKLTVSESMRNPIDSIKESLCESGLESPTNMTDKLIFSLNAQKENEIFIKLFPNPSTNVVFVHWGEVDIQSIELFDKKGAFISIVPIHKNMDDYEFPGLPSGEYFVRIYLKDQSTILKKVTFL